MRNPMNRRLPRELKSDLGKYAVIFAFLVMVISVVSGFLVADNSVNKAYREGFTKYNVEDGHISFKTSPSSETLDAVAESAGLTWYEADYFEEALNDGTLRTFQLQDKINIPCLMEGKLPEANDEIAIDRLYASNNKIAVGDTVKLEKGTLRVCGLIALPNYSSLFADNADLMMDSFHFGVALMSPEGFTAYDSDRVTVSYAWKYNTEYNSDKEGNDRSEKLLSALRAELTKENAGIFARMLKGEKDLAVIEVTDYLPRIENQAINFAGEDMAGDKATIMLFLYIVVVVMAFIVAVTCNNTITKEASVIGTLRASGYTRGEMIRHYMTLPVIVFAAGAVAGNVLGYTLLRKFMVNIYYTLYSLCSYKTLWNPDAFFVTTVIPIIIMLVINFLILAWKMRLGPLKFLRRELTGRTKKRALRLNEKIPFKSRFRIRILLQNLSNYATMVVGIILAAAIMIFGLMFMPMLDEAGRRIDRTVFCEYQYVLKTPKEVSDPTAERFAIKTLEMRKDDYKPDGISVYGISQNSQYIKTSVPDGEALLSNGFMDKYHVKAGDTVSLYDKLSDRSYSFKVAGEYSFEGALSVFVNLSDFNAMFEMPEDYYSGYFAAHELNELAASDVYMTIDSKTFSRFMGQVRASFADLMEPVKWFGVAMFVLMVYLLAKQIIERNQVSISMTKILGFTGGEIGGLYIVSTTIVVVFGLLLAIPSVHALLRLIFDKYLYKRMTGYFPYCISNDCYVKMVIAGLVSYLIVVALQMLKIRRIPKSEALKTLE